MVNGESSIHFTNIEETIKENLKRQQALKEEQERLQREKELEEEKKRQRELIAKEYEESKENVEWYNEYEKFCKLILGDIIKLIVSQGNYTSFNDKLNNCKLNLKNMNSSFNAELIFYSDGYFNHFLKLHDLGEISSESYQIINLKWRDNVTVGNLVEVYNLCIETIYLLDTNIDKIKADYINFLIREEKKYRPLLDINFQEYLVSLNIDEFKYLFDDEENESIVDKHVSASVLYDISKLMSDYNEFDFPIIEKYKFGLFLLLNTKYSIDTICRITGASKEELEETYAYYKKYVLEEVPELKR